MDLGGAEELTPPHPLRSVVKQRRGDLFAERRGDQLITTCLVKEMGVGDGHVHEPEEDDLPPAAGRMWDVK